MLQELLRVFGFTAAFTVFIGLCLKFGVVPTYPLSPIRRSDDPEAFDVAITIICVIVYGSMAILLFTTWAHGNSARLMATS